MKSILVIVLSLLPSMGSARDLPDPKLTPGVATALTTDEVCTKKWGKDARNVTAKMKMQVFVSYGLKGNKRIKECKGDAHGRIFEIDHLISRELGGADLIENLWPQCYSGKWNAVMKDRVENRLHKEVCSGHMLLSEAQKEIKTDYRIPHMRYFGQTREK